MNHTLRQILSGILPLAAVSSLVIGPSPAAVNAGYRHRLDVEEAASRSVPAETQTAESPANSPAQPRDDSEPFASFVAPASAKPAQSQWSDTMAAVSGDGAFVAALRCRGRQFRGEQGTAFRGLHRPVYRAHAPPIA